MKTFEEMQDALYKRVQQELLDGLARCTEANHRKFKMMYANGNMEWPLEKVVKAMPRAKLAWAIEQVQTTLDKQEAV